MSSEAEPCDVSLDRGGVAAGAGAEVDGSSDQGGAAEAEGVPQQQEPVAEGPRPRRTVDVELGDVGGS